MILWSLAGLVSLALAIGALVLDAAGLWWVALIFFGTAILSFVVLGFKVREELEYVRVAKPSAKRSTPPKGKGAPLKDAGVEELSAVKSPARHFEDTVARCQSLSRKELLALARESYRALHKTIVESAQRNKRKSADFLTDAVLLCAIAEDFKLSSDERRLFDSVRSSDGAKEFMEDRDVTREAEFRQEVRELCRRLPAEGINALITLCVAVFMLEGEITGRQRQMLEYFIGKRNS